MTSAIFLLHFFLASLEIKFYNLYLIFKYKMSVVFSYIYCYYKYTAENVEDVMIYFS